jgi:hypothetical protein
MDFIDCMPHHVIDLVFQHLTGREILSATVVSSKWNSFLSGSKNLKKIAVKINATASDLGILINSTRKYRNLYVANATPVIRQIVELISNPRCQFNTVIFFQVVLDEQKQIEQIFLNIAATIQKLELYFVSYITENGENVENTSYVFPHLETLKLWYDRRSRPWINEFISGFPKLKSLNLVDASDEKMKNLILKAPHLKHLELSGIFYDIMFYKDLSEKLPSQIEEYIFNDILSSSQEDENLRYFNAFFKSQSATLRRFSTDALLEPEEIETAFKMPNLYELEIKGFQFQSTVMESFMQAMRIQHPVTNLHTFTVGFMHDTLFELVALCATKLKTLKIQHLRISTLKNPSWFENLESLKVQSANIDDSLKNEIKNKPVDKRSHLEKLLFKAITK